MWAHDIAYNQAISNHAQVVHDQADNAVQFIVSLQKIHLVISFARGNLKGVEEEKSKRLIPFERPA